MSFFTLLLIFFIILILRPLWRGFIMYRRYRKAVRDAFGFNPGARSAKSGTSGRTSGQASSRANHQPGRPHKVFTKEMGEYVAFEEVAATASTTDNTGRTSSRTVVEQQVSDAEWEEIR